MLLSSKYRFAFVHIPKTGGTSIKKALLPYADPGQVSIEGEKVTDLNGWRPHEMMTLAKKNDLSGYKSFAFVRNPWSWHVSIWKFFQRPDRNNMRITGQAFSAYIIQTCSTDRPPYGLQMIDYVHHVDFVFRFERLQKDFDYMCSHLGIGQLQKLPHLKNAGDYDYRDMYNDELREMVAAQHKDDIGRFGYEF